MLRNLTCSDTFQTNKMEPHSSIMTYSLLLSIFNKVSTTQIPPYDHHNHTFSIRPQMMLIQKVIKHKVYRSSQYQISP